MTATALQRQRGGIGAMAERLVLLARSEVADGQGGRTVTWPTLDTIAAELVPLSTSERLANRTIVTAEASYRFRAWRRADVRTTMRVRWTPRWPPGAEALTLEVRGVLPDDADPNRMMLDCSEVQA